MSLNRNNRVLWVIGNRTIMEKRYGGSFISFATFTNKNFESN